MSDLALREFVGSILVGEADQGLADFLVGQVADLRKGSKECSVDQFVVNQFLTQCVAVDPKDFGRQGLVAAGLFEYDFKHWAFDALDHHRVNCSRLLAFKLLKVVFQRLADASCDMVIVVALYAASSSKWACGEGAMLT